MINARLSMQFDVTPNIVNRVTTLVNSAYSMAEHGLWQKTVQRVQHAEIAERLERSELMIATINGEIMGVVSVETLDDNTGGFGMLATDPVIRGLGVGRALIHAAERWALNQGLTVMRLELLTPRTWRHPVKESLKAWYRRLGYAPHSTMPFDQMYPHLHDRLATKCDFTVWLKTLSTEQIFETSTRHRPQVHGRPIRQRIRVMNDPVD